MLKGGPILPYEFEDIEMDPRMMDLLEANLRSPCHTSIVSVALDDRSYVLCRVYEYVTPHAGNIYNGKRVEKGVTKIGEFFEINDEVTEVIEEPVFYA